MTSEIKRGRIAIFEDDASVAGLFKMLLTLAKHEVVIEAVSLAEAMAAIDERVANLGSLSLEAAILDGNLRRGVHTNEDGMAIARHLRAQPGGEDLFILNVSATGEPIEGESMHLPKPDAPAIVRKIQEAIDTVKIVEGFVMTTEPTKDTRQP